MFFVSIDVIMTGGASLVKRTSLRVAVFAALLAFFLSCSAPGVGATARAPVVGARFVTCDTCKLNELPKLKDFFDKTIAKRYAAVEIDYVTGHNPDLELLDQYRRPVATYDVSPLSPDQIVSLLNQHGIFEFTAKPVYEDDTSKEALPSAHCVAFRRVGCDDMIRDPDGDLGCNIALREGQGGYCECKAGISNADVSCNQGYDEGSVTCEDLCNDLSLAERGL